MKQPTLLDYILLTILALIWASAFFNIKIATFSFEPITIAFLRVFYYHLTCELHEPKYTFTSFLK